MKSNQNSTHKYAIEEIIEKWEKQTAPDFFSTRILSQINSSVEESISYFSWATFGILLLLNCSILYKTLESQPNKLSSEKQNYTKYIEENYQLFTNYQTQL